MHARTFVKLCSIVIVALAGVHASAQPYPLTLAQLKKLNEHELARLFDNAPSGPVPLGYARGESLLMTSARMPRLQARFASSVWKGKHFEENGDFINQWIAFQALRGHAQTGTSWHDEKPCIVIEYPPNTPIFGNTRDELREVAPGLYLARLYERCPCPRLKGYFAIQACGAKFSRGS